MDLPLVDSARLKVDDDFAIREILRGLCRAGLTGVKNRTHL